MSRNPSKILPTTHSPWWLLSNMWSVNLYKFELFAFYLGEIKRKQEQKKERRKESDREGKKEEERERKEMKK